MTYLCIYLLNSIQLCTVTTYRYRQQTKESFTLPNAFWRVDSWQNVSLFYIKTHRGFDLNWALQWKCLQWYLLFYKAFIIWTLYLEDNSIRTTTLHKVESGPGLESCRRAINVNCVAQERGNVILESTRLKVLWRYSAVPPWVLTTLWLRAHSCKTY